MSRSQASDGRRVLQKVHIHDLPIYTTPRLPANPPSSTPASASSSRGTDGSTTEIPGRDVPVGESDSSGKDSLCESRTVDHLGGNAAGGGAASVDISRRGGAPGRMAAEGRRRRETCHRESSESMLVVRWAKRLRWSVMRDIIVTVRL